MKQTEVKLEQGALNATKNIFRGQLYLMFQPQRWRPNAPLFGGGLIDCIPTTGWSTVGTVISTLENWIEVSATDLIGIYGFMALMQLNQWSMSCILWWWWATIAAFST